MKAKQLFRYRAVQGALLVEMVIWQLPEATAERHHGLKYRLYCGNAGRCVVRYDNETGKGDHRHFGDAEESEDRFTSLDRLLADFREDCARLAGWRWE